MDIQTYAKDQYKKALLIYFLQRKNKPWGTQPLSIKEKQSLKITVILNAFRKAESLKKKSMLPYKISEIRTIKNYLFSEGRRVITNEHKVLLNKIFQKAFKIIEE